MENIDAKLGKRIISIVNSNPEMFNSIKELEKICDKYTKNNLDYSNKDGWGRKMILEWAYAGCVLVGLNGGNSKQRLKRYTEEIRKTLERNEFSDPAFYVREIFNGIFK